MHSFAVLSVLLVASVVVADQSWKQFKLDHGKNYHHPQVESLRKALYLKQDAIIKAHNSKPHTWKMAHSFISDLTQQERKAYLGVKIPSVEELKFRTETKIPKFLNVDRETLPASVDYRNDSCMTPVKYQGSCGSCWAFTAINTLEFANCKKNLKLSVLSEQQLVDCVYPTHNGCQGGWPARGLDYLINGSALATSIPYTATYGNCSYDPSMKAAAVATYVQPWTDESLTAQAELMQAALVQNSTIGVAIFVTNDWMSYGSGIYSNTTNCGTGVNHGVVIVGYGTQNGTDYWIVRNSWGVSWGDQGYILMKRGINQCNIEWYPVYIGAV